MTQHFAVAFTTTGSEAEARTLAGQIVTRGAAACVTIIPKAVSYYKWKGELCEDQEWLLMMKTTQERRPDIEAILGELHSYSVPELILLPIVAGSDAYLQWLGENVRPA